MEAKQGVLRKSGDEFAKLLGGVAVANVRPWNFATKSRILRPEESHPASPKGEEIGGPALEGDEHHR